MGNAETTTYQRPTLKIEFDETSSNPGLVVKGRRLTLGEMRRWERRRDELEAVDADADEQRQGLENAMLLSMFATPERNTMAGPIVREWNMVDLVSEIAHAVPLPTEETLEEYDQATLVEVMNAFVQGSRARRVSRPLPQPSAGTPISPEASMRTEPPSSPPAS